VSKNVSVVLPGRPPSFLSRSSLAAELDVCESTVDELVRRGVIPKPLRLTSGCVRWSWDAVQMALASFGGAPQDSDVSTDPATEGVKRFAEKLWA
jgi:predicted DNA-binding transcriptional regulator AlpA